MKESKIKRRQEITVESNRKLKCRYGWQKATNDNK